VRRAGPAEQAEPTVQRGDVLRGIGGRPVVDLDSLLELYGEMAEDESLVLELDRRGQALITRIEPRDDSPNDPPRELPKAWIGIATQPILPNLARSAGYGEQTGFRITRVYPGTRAAEADLEVGDLVISVDGESVEPRSMQDSALLSRRVRNLDIDATVELGVVRSGEPLAVPVRLERTRLDRADARRHLDRDFELTVRELTFFDRDESRWDPEVRGVIVETVESGGWASLGGLRSNDLVQRIGSREVKGLRSFRAALEAIKTEQPERVVVVVLRGARTYFQFLEPDWTPEDA
jgi:serine protease Do